MHWYSIQVVARLVPQVSWDIPMTQCRTSSTRNGWIDTYITNSVVQCAYSDVSVNSSPKDSDATVLYGLTEGATTLEGCHTLCRSVFAAVCKCPSPAGGIIKIEWQFPQPKEEQLLLLLVIHLEINQLGHTSFIATLTPFCCSWCLFEKEQPGRHVELEKAA